MNQTRKRKSKKKRHLKKSQKKMAQTTVPVVDHQKEEPRTHWTQIWTAFTLGLKDFMISIAILAAIVLGVILLFQGIEPSALLEIFLQVIL
nr:hypothetical protein [Fredinandcohnia onubensis]